jgi:imidazolonepropionase-like amidohydrolase
VASLSAPSVAQELVISGGTVHLPDGARVGTVVLRDGRIAEVGAPVAAPPGVTTINATGLHVYPGLFDAYSQLGLSEIESVSATVDSAEIGDYNPHLQAATAVHPASEAIPVARASGITHALVAPVGGNESVINGRAAVLHLDGWTIEEMAIDPDVGLVLRWPALISGRQRSFSQAEKEYNEQLDGLRDWLDAARHYRQALKGGDASRFEKSWELEALVPYVEGEKPILVLAERARQIRDAVALASEEGLEIILLGGAEAWKEKELLAEKGVPVILGPTQRLPREEDEGYDQPYAAPGELVAAGVAIAFGSFDSARARRLPYYAGVAAAYGLGKEEALAAVTIGAARMLGLGDELGTIEVGKRANLIVTDGDPLEIATQVRHLIIDGNQVALDNKHSRSYEKYRARPTQ